MEKNWEGLSDQVIGRIQRWRWILPQLSYRGRVLIINNLAASMLWHKHPPKDFLMKIQKAFVEFFWNGHHCYTYTYYQQTKNVSLFEMIWGVKEAIVTVHELGVLVFHW